MTLLLGWMGGEALAWECQTNCGCDWADGSQLTYHININDFSTLGQDAIEEGADAWDAGAGEIVRGADWDFVRGSDITSDGVSGNFVNEVYKKPSSFFEAIGEGSAAGMTIITHLGCGRKDADVIFNEGHTYTSKVPSEASGGAKSIGAVAIHEFGHVLGLEHNDETQAAEVAAMNTKGGEADIAGKYRINEDDYLGLVEAKGDSSTGKNLMLQRYWKPSTLESSAFEVWADPNLVYEGTWEGCPATTIAANNGPDAILAVIVGTSTQSPLIQWKLSSDTDCFSGTEYSLGTRTPTISPNEPYPVLPAGGYYIPSIVPPGTYYLCAMIDPGDQISESSENDNIIRSEWLFEVLSCP